MIHLDTFTGATPLYLLLYQFKGFRGDDSIMGVMDVPLFPFTIVDLGFLDKEIHGVGLLQPSITYILLVGQNAADGRGAPCRMIRAIIPVLSIN